MPSSTPVVITAAALDAIRAATPERRPFAIATYVAMLEMAGARLTRPLLAERVGIGIADVEMALSDLAAAGVLEAGPDGTYVVVEPVQR